MTTKCSEHLWQPLRYSITDHSISIYYKGSGYIILLVNLHDYDILLAVGDKIITKETIKAIIRKHKIKNVL